jgi:hypothetical protein
MGCVTFRSLCIIRQEEKEILAVHGGGKLKPEGEVFYAVKYKYDERVVVNGQCTNRIVKLICSNTVIQ